jgi:hypothetical protein
MAAGLRLRRTGLAAGWPADLVLNTMNLVKGSDVLLAEA